MPDVFLSYNREDQGTAQRFAEAFEQEGFSVWWDVTLRSGETYDQVTERALRSARAVVVLWSPRSVESRWVRAEATVADRNRTLVPARIEACDLPIMFELTQTADLSYWDGDIAAPIWRAFRADVQRFVETDAEPAPAAPPAPATEPPSPSKRPSRGARPSIAILPFINRSGVTEDDVVANGMAEDITVALSLSRRMKVIASSVVAAYRTGARDVRQIGRDLDVRYLLEGNVRRVGDDLRVTAQLVEAEDGDILWTQKFDRPLSELSALQEDLVTEVAAHLGGEVDRAEMEHALRKPGDITAWEAVLRAVAMLERASIASVNAAAAEAEKAIAIDPNYDLAHATYALCLAFRYGVQESDDTVLKQRALDAVARARAFDSRDPIVLARIASALDFMGSFNEGLPFAERAVSLNPRLEIPHISLGNILHKLGRWDDAIAQFEAIEQLAPTSYWWRACLFFRAKVELCAGRTERALELTERSLLVNYSMPSQIIKVLCLIELGRSNEGTQAMEHMRTMDPHLSFGNVERILRANIGHGVKPGEIDARVALLRKLWNEVTAEGASP
jgi:TolB-like protein